MYTIKFFFHWLPLMGGCPNSRACEAYPPTCPGCAGGLGHGWVCELVKEGGMEKW
jgi:hypothetical protein